MEQTETAQNSARPHDRLDLLLRSHRIQLCEPQRRRLAWLAARYGEPMVWDRQSAPPNRNGVLIVVEPPPTGPRTEFFCRALHPRCVVVIPFGENPVFDFLKSKLRDFGTIGPSGADGPHEFWWGGADWSMVLNGLAVARPPLIVSCHPRRADMARLRRLTRSIEALGLDCVVEAIDTLAPEMHGSEKARFIHRVWKRQDRPVLWVEPDAVVAGPPSLLEGIDCDFAVHKWNRWEMAARTLYFGRSSAAEALLQTWQHFASCHPMVWDGYLIDQAWSTVASQMPLETLWLPRSYHAASHDSSGRKAPVIVHEFETTTSNLGPDLSVPQARRAARRAGRIGAPEALVVMKSTENSERAVTVILRDVQSAGARAIAANVEAITRAFAKDSGGYGHLELSLCHWQEDVTATLSAANFGKNQILAIAPSDELSDSMFRQFSQSTDNPSSHNVVQLSAPKSAVGRTPWRSGAAPTTN
jgi:hypothetical protein